MKEHKEIRDDLIEMLEDLDKRLEKITEDVQHKEEPLSKDFAEQATETENDEVIDQLGLSARDMIARIKRAIGRIDNGGYGVCVVCGEKIPKKRLKILPYTDICVNCAEKRDGRQ